MYVTKGLAIEKQYNSVKEREIIKRGKPILYRKCQRIRRRPKKTKLDSKKGVRDQSSFITMASFRTFVSIMV